MRLPPRISAQRIAHAARPTLRADRVRIRTADDDRDNLTRGLTRLADYLALVALAALLLGGIGVASGVHVFVRQELDTMAILRCVGATSHQLLGAYFLQALAMGLAGSIHGTLIGVGLQHMVPAVVHDFIPGNVHVVPS